MTMKKKLVLVWVDNSGFELTGRYRDRLRQYPETRAVPKASAVCYGDDTPEMVQRVEAHVSRESPDHVWMGYFSLDNTSDLLNRARDLAHAAVKNEARHEHSNKFRKSLRAMP
jgi:hypothetical protein